jgi:hypothetical protein
VFKKTVQEINLDRFYQAVVPDVLAILQSQYEFLAPFVMELNPEATKKLDDLHRRIALLNLVSLRQVQGVINVDSISYILAAPIFKTNVRCKAMGMVIAYHLGISVLRNSFWQSIDVFSRKIEIIRASPCHSRQEKADLISATSKQIEQYAKAIHALNLIKHGKPEKVHYDALLGLDKFKKLYEKEEWPKWLFNKCMLTDKDIVLRKAFTFAEIRDVSIAPGKPEAPVP